MILTSYSCFNTPYKRHKLIYVHVPTLKITISSLMLQYERTEYRSLWHAWHSCGRMVSTENLKLKGIQTRVCRESCPLSNKQNQTQIFLKFKETQKWRKQFLDDKWVRLRLGVARPWRMVAKLVGFNYLPSYTGGIVATGRGSNARWWETRRRSNPSVFQHCWGLKPTL